MQSLRKPRDFPVLRSIAVVALLPVVARCMCECINSVASTSLPVVNDMWLTFFFSTFSLTHAASMLGWKRALTFSTVCVFVSWCFEAVGVNTGAVYGAYQYGNILGPKIAGVPILIPFAWFMMVYASWFVTHILLQDAAKPGSFAGILIRAFAASAVMTVWDTIMDPTMAAQGQWTWLQPGMYFGVPVHNFVGWLLTTFTIYLAAGALFRIVPGQDGGSPRKLYAGLPVIAYLSVAMARVFIASPPQLRVFAAFSMCLVGVLALIRLIFVPERRYLPE